MSGIKKKTRLMLALTFIFIIFLALFILGDLNLKPVILSMAEARARALAVEAINGAVATVIQDEVHYSDLVEILKDDTGQITGLQTNTMRMNELASRIVLQVQDNLKNIGEQGIRVPLGAALGNRILQGNGPEITVRVVPVGSATTEFQTEFQSAGINQTRHKIYLRAQMLVRLVIPTGSQSVEVSASVPIAETIIVGKVPDAYYNLENLETNDKLNLIPD